MPFYNQEEILTKTTGGLDIIIKLCPDATEAVSRQRNFKLRPDEKTASASLKELEDGTYVVTDWGSDSKSRNGILLWSHMRNVDFKTALEQIATEFGIMPEEKLKEIRQPDFNAAPAAPDQQEGSMDFEILPETPESWLVVVGPMVTNEVLTKYHWKPVKSYSLVKNRKTLTWNSRENYPIFIIEEPGFKKIYQPLSFEKADRFRYHTTEKPRDFMHGLSQASEMFYNKNPHEADGYSEGEAEAKEREEGKQTTEKLPEIIICSGDRDAMNVAGMGYIVVWKNSESAKITGATWKQLSKIAERVYNLPDIDTTGIKQGHSLAHYYLDLYTIWLPQELLKFRDWRGNPRKDLRDFVETYRQNSKRKFKDLLKISYPYRFWDYMPTQKGMKPEVNNVHLYNFLTRSGFYRFEMEGIAEGFIYIHIQGNTVREVNPVQIRAYINDFLTARHEDVRLRNHFYRSPHLNAQSLQNLPTTRPDFVSYSKLDRHFFFKDKVVKVDKESIGICKPGTVEKYVWEDNVIDHSFEPEKNFFDVDFTIDESGRQHINDITVHDDKCLFFRYLIQTSRIHWAEELESRTATFTAEDKTKYLEANKFKIDGPNLNEDEIHEQKAHLVNKIFTIGYILHRYRSMNRSWVPYAMDNRISESGESFGGSGKSILFNIALGKMSNMFYKGARDNKIFEDRFIFHGVTKHTDFILFDDAGEYFNFDFLYPYITGQFNVNPKNNQPYSVPAHEAPIIGITTNYTPRKTDASTLRRILFLVFSDYYHKEGEFYKEDRDPEKDLGKQLLGPDYTNEDWNNFFNFMLQCLKFYLKLPSKVDPPMSNVELRNLRSQMGDTFFDWAEVYFSPTGDKINQELVKRKTMEEFMEETNTSPRFINPGLFKKKLIAYSKYSGLLFNAAQKGKRFIKKVDGKATEMITLEAPDFIKPEAELSESEKISTHQNDTNEF